MYRTLAEAAANCTRNIATGYGPVFSDRKALGGAAILTRPEPLDEITRETETGDPAERVAKLVKALQEPDCGTRVSAVCALAKLGPASQEAVPALMEALEDKDWVVRVAAITALGGIGEGARAAVPALVEALEKEDVCASATIALGRIGPAAKAALEPLAALHKSKSGFVRWCAEEASRAIGR